MDPQPKPSQDEFKIVRLMTYEEVLEINDMKYIESLIER